MVQGSVRFRETTDAVNLIGKKKLRRITPAVEVKDPCIMTALIALAQKQREHSQKAGMETSEPAETMSTLSESDLLPPKTSPPPSPSCLELSTKESQELTTYYKVLFCLE